MSDLFFTEEHQHTDSSQLESPVHVHILDYHLMEILQAVLKTCTAMLDTSS